MGKKKLESFDKIEDKNALAVTYCKRKRGLIKKGIELSQLCDQFVYIVIFDKEKQRLVEYCSTSDFNSKVVSKLASPDYRKHLKYENYNNGHYSFFEKNFISKAENAIPNDKEPDINNWFDQNFKYDIEEKAATIN